MERLVGAGVICFSRDEAGRIRLLLGREREVIGWRQGSRKWSTFSGRAEEGESAARTAAREFLEETCGSASLDGGGGEEDSVHRVLLGAPTVERTLQNDRGALLSHVTFLCEVPFDPEVSARFSRTRDELLSLDAVFRDYYQIKKKAEALTRLVTPGFQLAAGIVTTNFWLEEPDVLLLECRGEAGDVTDVTLRLSPEAFADARRLHASWQKVQSFVLQHGTAPIFSHPAVRVMRHGGQLTAAYVNKAFLEKTELAWWDLAELERLGRERWRGGDDFRRYFLDNLRFIAPQIRALSGEGRSEEAVINA